MSRYLIFFIIIISFYQCASREVYYGDVQIEKEKPQKVYLRDGKTVITRQQKKLIEQVVSEEIAKQKSQQKTSTEDRSEHDKKWQQEKEALKKQISQQTNTQIETKIKLIESEQSAGLSKTNQNLKQARDDINQTRSVQVTQQREIDELKQQLSALNRKVQQLQQKLNNTTNNSSITAGTVNKMIAASLTRHLKEHDHTVTSANSTDYSRITTLIDNKIQKAFEQHGNSKSSGKEKQKTGTSDARPESETDNAAATVKCEQCNFDDDRFTLEVEKVIAKTVEKAVEKRVRTIAANNTGTSTTTTLTKTNVLTAHTHTLDDLNRNELNRFIDARVVYYLAENKEKYCCSRSTDGNIGNESSSTSTTGETTGTDQNQPVIQKTTVYFASASSRLTERARIKLDRLNLKGKPIVVIRAHTDSVGNVEYNKKLSKERAKRVKDYLFLKNKAARFVIRAYGESKPRSSNENRQGRLVNRRVEVVINNSP